MNDAQLVAAAIKGARHAYCPYSGFSVGAALLAEDGRIFTGCNVENASYGLTICAERNALANAIANGSRSFVAIAVVASQPPAPCGACRQVLAEFAAPSFRILLAAIGAPEAITAFTMEDLLPHSFSRHHLEEVTPHED